MEIFDTVIAVLGIVALVGLVVAYFAAFTNLL